MPHLVSYYTALLAIQLYTYPGGECGGLWWMYTAMRFLHVGFCVSLFSASSLAYFVGGVPLSRPFAVLLAAVKLTAPRSRSVPLARVLALHYLAGTPIHASVHVSVA